MTDQTHDFDLESADLDDFLTIDAPTFTVPAIRADDYSVTDDEDGDGYVFDHVRQMVASDRNPSRFEASLFNATVAINHDERIRGAFGFDKFVSSVVVKRPFTSEIDAVGGWTLENENGDMLEESHVLTVQTWLQAPYKNPGEDGGYNCLVSTVDTEKAIDKVARRKENVFDSLTDSLDALVWDGVPRLATALHRYVGSPADEYHAQIFTKYCVGSVARAFEPGHKFDFVPAFIGGQGTRKSTFVQVLGGQFFRAVTKKAFLDPQRTIEQTQGAWIVELPENAALHKSSNEDSKASVSNQVDRDRMAYGKKAGDHKRRWTMIITTNDRAFLQDPTGNRRYWVIIVTFDVIDIDLLIKERDQLWAEAVAIYKQMRIDFPKSKGDLPLQLTPDVEVVARKLQDGAMMGDDISDLASSIRAFLETPKDIDGDLEVDGHLYYAELDKAEIWHGVTNGQGGEFHNNSAAKKINAALKTIEYVSISKHSSTIKRLNGKKANKVIIDVELFRKALRESEEAEVAETARVEEEFVAVAPGVEMGEDGQGVGGREEKSADGMEMGGEAPAVSDSFDDLDEQAPEEVTAPAPVEVKAEVAAPEKVEPAPAPKVVDQLDESPF